MTLDLTFLQGHDLTIYHTTWCPDCKRLDRWLSEQGLTPSQVNIEDDADAATKLEDETGKRAVPFILVNNKTWVRGYHKEQPARFDPALLVEELREAVTA